MKVVQGLISYISVEGSRVQSYENRKSRKTILPKLF